MERLTCAITDATSGCWSAKGKKIEVMEEEDCAAARPRRPLAVTI